MSSSSVEDGGMSQGVGAKGAGGSLLDANPSMHSNSGHDASHYSSHTGFSLLPDARLLPIGAGCLACAHFMPMCCVASLLAFAMIPCHVSAFPCVLICFVGMQPHASFLSLTSTCHGRAGAPLSSRRGLLPQVHETDVLEQVSMQCCYWNILRPSESH